MSMQQKLLYAKIVVSMAGLALEKGSNGYPLPVRLFAGKINMKIRKARADACIQVCRYLVVRYDSTHYCSKMLTIKKQQLEEHFHRVLTWLVLILKCSLVLWSSHGDLLSRFLTSMGDLGGHTSWKRITQILSEQGLFRFSLDASFTFPLHV